jgi:hypothetical protein
VFFCLLHRSITVDLVWGDAWAKVKTSFRLGLTLLDFCYLFAIGMLDLVPGEALAEVETSFQPGLILLDFCYFMALVLLDRYRMVVCRVSYPCLDYRILWYGMVWRFLCLTWVSYSLSFSFAIVNLVWGEALAEVKTWF